MNNPALPGVMDSTVLSYASAKTEVCVIPDQDDVLVQQEPWERIVREYVLQVDLALIAMVSAVVARMENATLRMVCVVAAWAGEDQPVKRNALLDVMALDVYTHVNVRMEGCVTQSVDAAPAFQAIMANCVKSNVLPTHMASTAKNSVTAQIMPSATTKQDSANARQATLATDVKKNVNQVHMACIAKKNVTVGYLDAILRQVNVNVPQD